MYTKAVVLLVVGLVAAAYGGAPTARSEGAIHAEKDEQIQLVIGQIHEFIPKLNILIEAAEDLQETHGDSLDMDPVLNVVNGLKSESKESGYSELYQAMRDLGKEMKGIKRAFRKVGRLVSSNRVNRMVRVRDTLQLHLDELGQDVSNELLRSCYMHQDNGADINNGEFYANDGICYWYSGQRKNWQDARQDCLNRGMDLASIVEQSQQEYLVSILSPQNSGLPKYWLSGHRDGNHDFVWFALGNQALTSAYTNWHAGEPNDYGTGESCLTFWGSWQWNDLFCTNHEKYVCQTY